MKDAETYSAIVYRNGTFLLQEMIDDEFEDYEDVFDFHNEQIIEILQINPALVLKALNAFCSLKGGEGKIVGGYTASGTACFMFDDDSAEIAILKLMI